MEKNRSARVELVEMLYLKKSTFLTGLKKRSLSIGLIVCYVFTSLIVNKIYGVEGYFFKFTNILCAMIVQ